MVVLHINGARAWGGNEQQLSDIIPELEKLGVQNVVMGVKGKALHNYCESQGIAFIAAKNVKLNKKENYRYLSTVVKDLQPDIIHLHTSDSATVYTISDLIFRLKTPAVFSKKGMGKSMSVLSVFKYNYKNIKAIICVSEAVKSSMQRLVMKNRNVHKLSVIYDGINVNRLIPVRNEKLSDLFPETKNKRLLGNIANHVRAKDLGILFEAIHYLKNDLKVNNFHLVQIGKESALTTELKAKIQELGIENEVTLAGFQKNATDFLPQFELYIMSSEREGLPLTIYEAFYKNVPVVSTKAGGIPEVIEDGVNGFLANIKDPVVLANKIHELLDNETLKENFTQKSYELFINNYQASSTAKHTLQIYKSILK